MAEQIRVRCLCGEVEETEEDVDDEVTELARPVEHEVRSENRWFNVILGLTGDSALPERPPITDF